MPFLQKKASPLTMNYTQLHTFTHYEAMKITDIFFPLLIIILYILFLLKKDMYPFTIYLKFLIKDVKIIWVRSMKGISSPPPGTVDRDRRNTPNARTAMSIFSLRLAAIDCLGAIWWRLVM